MTQMPQRVEGSIHTVQIVGKEWFKMGRKIGFWVLSFWMGAVAVTFLMAPIQSSGTDGVTFFSGVLMALVWGSVAILSALFALEKYDSTNIRWGWSVLTFICGNLAAIGIGSITAPGGSQNFLIGIICAVLMCLCAKKACAGRFLPENRKYNPGDPLPVTVCPGLLLSGDEVCHICENIKIGKVKNVSVGSVSNRSGGSVRVARGLSIHSGSSRSRTIRADVFDASNGKLYVTNKRVVAASPKYSFNERLSSIVTISLYSDGFALQFGSKNYTIIVRDPTYVATIMQIAAQASIQ